MPMGEKKGLFRKREDKIVDVNVEELEKEGNNRLESIGKILVIIVGVIGVAWTIFQIYTGFFGLLPAVLQRATTMGFALVLTFLGFSAKRKGGKKDHIPFYDWILAALSVAIVVYLFINYKQLVMRGGSPLTMDIVMGCIAILLVIEAARRVVGLPLVMVACVFLAYAFLGPYLPGMLGHRGYGIDRVASQMYITLEGILGTPMSVATTFVFAFILFGSFLEATGGAKQFIDLAFSLTGKYAGGPAKTAVVASGLLGTISGSSLANVVTTGSFTIPLMKKTGYKASFAGGVESSASSAGQIMPPVMGAAAFIMAETTGIPYLRICGAAAIPAVLYYLAVFLSVDMEARRTGLKGISKDQIPNFLPTLKLSAPLLIPLVVIVVLMVMGFSPLRAALVSTLVMFVGSCFSKHTRLTPAGFIEALKKSAFNAISVTVACAICGIITGVITLTGLGLKLSDLILAASGGVLLPTLFLTMIASIILGMGLPTTAKYIVLAAIAAPAMTRLGVPLVGAHLFILYFGVIAELTPPVALTSYAGAAVAKAPGMEKALQGLKISIAAFFIPFMFVLYPSLLFENVTVVGMATGLLSSFVGVTCLAAAAIGYMFGQLKIWQRGVLLVAVFLLVHTSIWTDLGGIVIIVAIAAMQLIKRKNQKVS
jgi:TRAP transporter 4TM/12TM fusion protein